MTDVPDVRTQAQLLEDFAGGQPHQRKLQNLIETIFNLHAEAIEHLSVAEVTEDGALSLTSGTDFITTGAGAMALTLADGTEGQVKRIVMVVDGGGAATLTPANYGNGDTLTFDDAGDSAQLVFRTGNWWNVGTPTATVA